MHPLGQSLLSDIVNRYYTHGLLIIVDCDIKIFVENYEGVSRERGVLTVEIVGSYLMSQ